MSDEERQSFTVGVFQDTEWAERGLEALAKEGFPSESLSMISKESPEASALLQRTFAVDGTALDIVRIGPVVAHGPLLGTLHHRLMDGRRMSLPCSPLLCTTSLQLFSTASSCKGGGPPTLPSPRQCCCTKATLAMLARWI